MFYSSGIGLFLYLNYVSRATWRSPQWSIGNSQISDGQTIIMTRLTCVSFQVFETREIKINLLSVIGIIVIPERSLLCVKMYESWHKHPDSSNGSKPLYCWLYGTKPKSSVAVNDRAFIGVLGLKTVVQPSRSRTHAGGNEWNKYDTAPMYWRTRKRWWTSP